MSDLRNISLFDAGLTPMDKQPTMADGKSVFMTDARAKNDRRKNGDRRKEIRFEENRRKDSRRRTTKTWEDGKNL